MGAFAVVAVEGFCVCVCVCVGVRYSIRWGVCFMDSMRTFASTFEVIVGTFTVILIVHSNTFHQFTQHEHKLDNVKVMYVFVL